MHSAFIPSVGLAPVGASQFVPHAHVNTAPAPAAAVKMMFGIGGNRGRRLRGPGGMGGGGMGGGSGGGRGDSGGRGAGAGGGRSNAGGGSGSLSGDNNPFKIVHAAYLEKLSKYTIATKMATSFVGFAVATLLAEGKGDPDWGKVSRNGIMGAIVHGLGGHYYYGASERALPGQAPLNVIGKSVIDFLAAVPLISVSFVAIDAALNDSTPGDIFDKMKSSWKIPAPIWAMWSCLTMYVPPVEQRVLFYNGVIVFSGLAKKLADKAQD